MERPDCLMRKEISHSELLSTAKTDRNFVQEMLYSAAYAGVQAPIAALSQCVDKTCNSKFEQSTKFMDSPEQSEFLSSRWHAQQLGGALGMVAPFLLLHKGVGKAAGRFLGEAETKALASRELTLRVAGEAAVTGALYEGFLRPVTDRDGDFLAARLRNAATGALTFGTLAAGAGEIKHLARAESGIIGKMVRSEVGAGMLASIPAGIVNAEANSLLKGNGFATSRELTETTYGFLFAGGALSIGKAAVGGTVVEARQNKLLAQESATSISRGEPNLAQRMENGLRSTGSQVVAAVEQFSGPQLRPALQTNVGAPFMPETVVHMSRPPQLRGGLNERPGGFIPPELADIIKSKSPAKEAPARQEHGTPPPEVPKDSPTPPPLKPAEVFPDGTFYFEDLNHPGVVYRGTQAHMDGLAREGGFPHRSKFSRPIIDEKMRYELSDGTVEWWDVRELRPDHFWTWPDEKYDAGSTEHPEVTAQREIAEFSKGTVLETPVVQEVLQKARQNQLHRHPDSVVVFVDTQGKVIHYDGINGREARFSLYDCARPNLLKSRLSGHEVAGAVVFMPNPQRVGGAMTRPFIPSRYYGITQIPGRITLQDFIESRK